MALAEKSNGDKRIFIDPAALMKEQYRMPTLNDVLNKLNGAKLFTKLDVKEAYWYVRLDDKSSQLTTMITPFGRSRWLRLPIWTESFKRNFSTKDNGSPGGSC